MKKTAIFILALIVCIGVDARRKPKSIVILYENDVHCAIDGYPVLTKLRAQVADTANVAVVSSGDFLQGGTSGAISRGEYITAIMQTVGYDAVTLGNHEFDYQVSRMVELIEKSGIPVTCTNFFELGKTKPYYLPYIIKKVGKKKVAFIGTVTPTTLETEQYAFFDKKGTQLYDLRPTQVYQLVQEAVNAARKKGAKYCIVLSHLGEDDNDMHVTSHGLVASTTGIDAVLDGHTHNVIPCQLVANKQGKMIPVSQTGTKFFNVGHLLIDEKGRVSTRLIPIRDTETKAIYASLMTGTPDRTQTAADSINKLVDEQTARVVCHSDFPITILDSSGAQAVRCSETNAGDLVCDAFRAVTGAQIAINNGGGIRNQLSAGDLTYGDIISLLPFDNYLETVEVTGQDILDVLEACCQLLPERDGQFAQVSGMRYTVDTGRKPRVQEVEVLNDGKFEPIQPDKKYVLCTTDYCIDGGGMYGRLKDCRKLKESIIRYNDALIKYVTEHLNGKIPEVYRKPQGRIIIR